MCLFSQVCSNADELFEVEEGEPFRCDFDRSGFDALRTMLLEGPAQDISLAPNVVREPFD